MILHRKRESIYIWNEYLLISSVGSKKNNRNIRTDQKAYEQTKKHAISKELIKIFFPCYFLLNEFCLKFLLYIFLVMQTFFEATIFEATIFEATIFEIITTLQLCRQELNSRKIFSVTVYCEEGRQKCENLAVYMWRRARAHKPLPCAGKRTSGCGA